MEEWMKKLPRLSELDGDFKGQMLLAVITEADLMVSENTKLLEVNIKKDPYIVTNGKQRKMINALPRPSLSRVLDVINLNPRARRTHSVATEEEPLLAFGAGVLPIITMEERKYVLAFLRDINPVGFNTASGITDTFFEVLYPASVIFREFYQELLIMSLNRKCLYECNNPRLTDVLHRPYWEANIKLWNLKPEVITPTFISSYPMASKELICIFYDGSLVKKLEHVAISIPPTMGEINGIMPVRVHIPDGEEKELSDLAIFDCELHWKHPDIPLNRTVVAFDMDYLVPGKRPRIVATWSCGFNPNQLSVVSTVEDTLRALRQ